MNQAGVIHLEICDDAVFTDGFDDKMKVFLAGFSKALGNAKLARRDCFQVFKAILNFLDLMEPPYAWTGYQSLDNLCRQHPEYNCKSWPYTAEDVMGHLKIDPDVLTELWTTFRVFKDVTMGYISYKNTNYFNGEDLERFLRNGVVRYTAKGAGVRDWKRLAAKVSTAFPIPTSSLASPSFHIRNPATSPSPILNHPFSPRNSQPGPIQTKV
ncbi:hypothetical protein B0O99DRAFT_686744 [Bisporella sp. PMI_857]|nr:hypothetical protein B0O99DRAFT_686744 [Bisporella sp. PMI_857]